MKNSSDQRQWGLDIAAAVDAFVLGIIGGILYGIPGIFGGTLIGLVFARIAQAIIPENP